MTVENYIEWVQEKITLLKEQTKKIYRKDISLNDIKEILSSRLEISLFLNSEYQRFKFNFMYEKRRFDVWWSEKYTSKRGELNPRNLSGNKWLSQKEIQQEVINDYQEEYTKWQDTINDFEMQMEFIKRLMDDWNSISFDLNNLIKSIEIEVYSLSNTTGVTEVRRRQRTTN